MSADLQTNARWRPAAGPDAAAGPRHGARPEIEVASSYREMLALEPEWNDLYARAGVQHPFLTHEWIRTWWECFGAPTGLEILVFRDGPAGAIALVPLMADATRMFGVGLARLGLPWNFHTPRLGLVVAERHEEVYRLLWEHLRRQERRWDLLRLCQLPEGSPESRRLADLAASEGFPVGRWTSGGAPFVEVRGSWDDYFAGLSKKHRSTVRNRTRRLRTVGPVELETVDGSEGGDDLERALTEGFRLEGAAWKAGAGTAILSHDETETFYRILARRTAARGWLRLHFLRVGGRRVAFLYSLLHEGTLYALKGGYAPEHARSSPGVVLFSLILKDAFERGLRRIDFLGEEERWKLDWTRCTREHHWLYVFRPSSRTRLVHMLKFGLAPRARSAEPAPPPFHLPLMARSGESRP
jgi:CelD/BcsL family acetyltransferase involved in cellulose biosynthesis